MARKRRWVGCKMLPFKKNWHGAKSSWFDAGFLAEEIWPGVDYGRAFAYLFRRFGETAPFDYHKQLCTYNLTTPDKEVGFWLSCSPSTYGMRPGFWLSDSLYMDIAAERRISLDWPVIPKGDMGWLERVDPPAGTFYRRGLDAIAEGMRDLLRPVYIRDMPINILGYLSDEDAGKYRVANRAWKE